MAIKLKLPPGFFHNGTEYQAAGRWHRGNLVRWAKGVLQPINGWRKKIDPTSQDEIAPLWSGEAPRGGIALYEDAAGAVALVLGTNKRIYRLLQSGAVSDITPAGFPAQSQDAVSSTGYGTMSYDRHLYGVARPSVTENIKAVFTWGLTNWGFWPVAVARGLATYPLYIKTSSDSTFQPITNSPLGAFDALVTDERFLMTFGKATDHLLIEWSDREAYTVWSPAKTNEAGSYRLSGKGRLMRGVTTQNRILVIGEVDVFVGMYLGPPYVYGFDRVSENCGLQAANAVVATEQFAVWLGQNNFWIYDGEVRELPCEVWGYLKRDIDKTQISKTYAFTIARYSEVWWLYQSNDSLTGEHDSYIVFNYAMNVWYFGKLDRSLGIDNNILRNPIMVTHSGHVYDHELIDHARDTELAYIESGPLEAENGTRMVGFQWMYPDVYPTAGALTAFFSVRDMPNLDVRYERNISLSNPMSTTGLMGRAITLRLEETATVANWEIGDFRVEPLRMAGPQR